MFPTCPTCAAVHPGAAGRTRPARPTARRVPAGSVAGAAPSSSSVLSCGVEVLELDAGVLGGEPPVDPATGPVARRLPRGDLPLQRRPVAQATGQALPGQ